MRKKVSKLRPSEIRYFVFVTRAPHMCFNEEINFIAVLFFLLQFFDLRTPSDWGMQYLLFAVLTAQGKTDKKHP